MKSSAMLIVSKCDTINAALFYLCKVVEGNMSRTFTFRQLTSCLEVREILKRLTDPNIPLSLQNWMEGEGEEKD